MKFERKEVPPSFTPVVMTLESQVEVDLIYRLLGMVSIKIAEELVGEKYDSMDAYEAIAPFVSPQVEAGYSPHEITK